MNSLSLCALGLLVVSLCRSAEPPLTTYFEGPSKCALKFDVIADGKAIITATVQGERHTMFLDTGATTILDLSVARQLHLPLVEAPDVGYGLTGVAGTRWIGRVDFQIGKMKITGFPVSCMDLSGLRDLNHKNGLPELDGLIGSDLLAMLRAQIDYSSQNLTIRRPTHFR